MHADSINVDVNQEATMHLVHTGTIQAPSHMAGMDSLLEQTLSHMSAEVVPEHRSYLNQVSMSRQRSGSAPRYSPAPNSGQRSGRSLGRPSSLGRPNSGNSRPNSGNSRPNSGHSPEAAQAFLGQGGGAGAAMPPYQQHTNLGRRGSPPGPLVGSSPSQYRHQRNQQPAPQYALYNNMLAEGNAASQTPARGQQPWIMVSQTSEQGAPHSRGASVPSSPRGRANFNGGLPGEQPVTPQDAYYNSSNPYGAQSARGSQRGRGRGVGEAQELTMYQYACDELRSASVGGRPRAVCESRQSAAARASEERVQGSSAADLIMSVGVRGSPLRPVGEGRTPPPHEGYSNAGLSFIEENMSSMTGPSGLDLGNPPPARQSFLGGTGLMGGTSDAIASSQLPGVPTVSRPMDPGSYNQANAMLRKQLPHYKVRLFVSGPCTGSIYTCFCYANRL